MKRYYTMIGSRETPEDVLRLMEDIAEKLASQHWTGRSGGADGADTSLEVGCGRKLCGSMEIYLPWEGFNGRSSENRGYISTPKMSNYKQAEKIAEETHPAWDKCSRGARALHTRNVYQLLGKDLATPSRFVICWAKPTGIGDNVRVVQVLQ